MVNHHLSPPFGICCFFHFFQASWPFASPRFWKSVGSPTFPEFFSAAGGFFFAGDREIFTSLEFQNLFRTFDQLHGRLYARGLPYGVALWEVREACWKKGVQPLSIYVMRQPELCQTPRRKLHGLATVLHKIMSTRGRYGARTTAESDFDVKHESKCFQGFLSPWSPCGKHIYIGGGGPSTNSNASSWLVNRPPSQRTPQK